MLDDMQPAGTGEAPKLGETGLRVQHLRGFLGHVCCGAQPSVSTSTAEFCALWLEASAGDAASLVTLVGRLYVSA